MFPQPLGDFEMAQVTQTATETGRAPRFSFGPVWSAAVVAGTIKSQSHEKLIAHAVHLKIAARSDAKRLKFDTLLAKVAAAITAAQNEPAEVEVEVEAETA
jgi:hypothetical protein